MSASVSMITLRPGAMADLSAVDGVMREAFDPRFGEAWTPSQVTGVLAMPGVWLTIAEAGGAGSGGNCCVRRLPRRVSAVWRKCTSKCARATMRRPCIALPDLRKSVNADLTIAAAAASCSMRKLSRSSFPDLYPAIHRLMLAFGSR
jgi:hypothetical protein